MKQYVICGDSREYFDYLKRTNTGTHTHVYLHDAEQIRGLSEVHGVFVGSWRERPEINDIIWAIRVINDKHPLSKEQYSYC
jgi:hypothetical protein